MVVLKPTLPGERFRVCSCGVIGLASPIKERTTFYPRANTIHGAYRALCRVCSMRQSNAYQKAHPEAVQVWNGKRRANRRQRMATDPAYREHERARDRERKRKRMQDPEARRRAHEAERRYRRKHAKRLAEEERIDRRLRALDAGRLKVADAPGLENNARRGRRYPIGPFREWLEKWYGNAFRSALLEGHSEIVAENKAIAEIINVLGTDTRTVYRWRHEATVISDAALDQVATRHGQVLPYVDWYPEGFE